MISFQFILVASAISYQLSMQLNITNGEMKKLNCDVLLAKY